MSSAIWFCLKHLYNIHPSSSCMCLHGLLVWVGPADKNVYAKLTCPLILSPWLSRSQWLCWLLIILDVYVQGPTNDIHILCPLFTKLLVGKCIARCCEKCMQNVAILKIFCTSGQAISLDTCRTSAPLFWYPEALLWDSWIFMIVPACYKTIIILVLSPAILVHTSKICSACSEASVMYNTGRYVSLVTDWSYSIV